MTIKMIFSVIVLNHVCLSHPWFFILTGLSYNVSHTSIENPAMADRGIDRMDGWMGRWTELQIFIQDTVNQLASYSLFSVLLSFHCNL